MLAALAWAGAAAAQPDYNRDCVQNFNDSLAFMNDYAARSPAADLNLDGQINQADFDSFADSKAKTNFQLYWQVSTVLEGTANNMDTLTNLAGAPVNRNCEIIYEQEFPKIPIAYNNDGVPTEGGFHWIFRDLGGGYLGWRVNYDLWMTEHMLSLPVVMARTIPANFDGILCIDWETVTPLRQYQVVDPTALRLWDEAVEQINSPALNQDFLNFAGWTRPSGATLWSDLTSAQRTDLLNTSFQRVAMDFFIRTVQGCRIVRPNAKFGFYGLPQGAWPLYDEERRGLNDLLADLWREVDVLSPSTYPLYWTTNDRDSSPCPEAVNTVSQNAVFYRSLIEEMLRLKATFPRPNQQIISYASWHYKAQAGQCSPYVTPGLFTNAVNTAHQLQLPWWYGADGVAIWGHYGNYPRSGPDTPANVGAEMRANWTPLIQRLSCPR